MFSKNLSKIYAAFFLMIALCHSFADDHSGKLGFSEFHYFNVTNPMGFIGALDKHYASECAEKWQGQSGANVSLWQISGSDVSHMIYVGYTGYEQMEIGRDLFSSCLETAEMLATISKMTNPGDYHNVIVEGAISRNQPSGIQKFYTKFDVNIDSGMESKYVQAWLNLMEAQGDQLQDSHYGINRIPFGNGFSTHYVYFSGDNLSKLMDNVKSTLSSRQYAAFVRTVGKFRQLTNTTLLQFVKAYPAERE